MCSITLISIRIMAARVISSRLAPFIMMTNAHANISNTVCIPSLCELWESIFYCGRIKGEKDLELVLHEIKKLVGSGLIIRAEHSA